MIRRRSTLLVLCIGLLLAAMLPAAVSAGSLVREADVRTTISCELEGAAGTVAMFAESSDRWGDYSDLAIWTATPDGPPDMVASGSDIAIDPSGIIGSFDLVRFDTNAETPFGDAAGTATITASFTAAGDPEPFAYRDRDGNRVMRVSGSSQRYDVSGVLDVDLIDGSDGLYDLSGCYASTVTSTLAVNDPVAYVRHDQRISISCMWSTEHGIVYLFGASDDWGAFSDLFIIGDDGEVGGFSEATFTSSLFEADYELYDFETGDPVGSASASASLADTRDRIRFRDTFGTFRYSAHGWALAVDGDMTLDLGGESVTLAMDMQSCEASDLHITEMVRRPSGPRLKNDAPAGALPLEIGSTVEVRTGGATIQPEAPCTVSFDGDSFEVPIQRTAWWTFEGTGGEVTIDTSGSDFDTVVGVYTLEAGEYAQVGCVDDVFEEPDGSLQARITVDTIAGTTYYVQVGGYGGASGRLVLSAR